MLTQPPVQNQNPTTQDHFPLPNIKHHKVCIFFSFFFLPDAPITYPPGILPHRARNPTCSDCNKPCPSQQSVSIVTRANQIYRSLRARTHPPSPARLDRHPAHQHVSSHISLHVIPDNWPPDRTGSDQSAFFLSTDTYNDQTNNFYFFPFLFRNCERNL